MKESTSDPKRVKPRTRRRTKPASKTRVKGMTKRHPQVNAAIITIGNVYYHGFEKRGTRFKIDRAMIRRLLKIETLSTAAIAALVKTLRERGFLMSALDATPKEWIVEKIDPRELPVVTDDVIQEAEEKALDKG